MKIISLVPSITELLFDLHLEKEVVGITKFCVHPSKWHQSKQKVGGTKNLNIPKILELNADILIANKEENVKDQIDALSQNHEVILTDIKTPQDNLSLIQRLSALTDRNEIGVKLIKKYNNAIDTITAQKVQTTAAYLIWQNPIMSVGHDTYINHVMDLCGIKNVLGERTRYPTIDVEELNSLKPEWIFLSSEPYPFKESHLKKYKTLFPSSKVRIVDGEAFSWYGTRLIHSKEWLTNFMAEINSK